MTATSSDFIGPSGSMDAPSSAKFQHAPDIKTRHSARSKMNMRQMSQSPAQRLVEYFVVVSSVPRKDVPSDQVAQGGLPGSPSSSSNNGSYSYSAEFDEIPQNISIEDIADMDEDGSLNFEPVITARYPQQDHPGNPLHQSVACFCYPGGIIKLKSKPCMPKVSVLYFIGFYENYTVFRVSLIFVPCISQIRIFC